MSTAGHERTVLAPPVRIDDADDPRIAVFRNVRERDLVGRDGIFIAEGLSVLSVLLTRSSIEPLALLVEEGRAPRLPVLAHRGAAPCYVAPQRVLDAIAGFHLHRGILGAGRIPPPSRLETVLPGRTAVRLPVLVTLANHDNVGGLYRNAAAFGAPAVAIDAGTADPFYRKAIRVGVGAPLVMPTVRVGQAADLLPLFATHAVTPYALTPHRGRPLGAAPLAARAAFLLGAEGAGLPQPLIDACEPLAIATTNRLDSLNVATAGAIVLHAHASAHGLG